MDAHQISLLILKVVCVFWGCYFAYLAFVLFVFYLDSKVRKVEYMGIKVVEGQVCLKIE